MIVQRGSHLDVLLQAVRGGDAAAYVPLADELADAGHPQAEELMNLAIDIRDCDDESVVMMSIAVFEELIFSFIKRS